MANTFNNSPLSSVYKIDMQDRIAEKLREKHYFENIAEVKYTNNKQMVHISTAQQSVSTHTPGTAMTTQDKTATTESYNIDISRNITNYYDSADLAQLSFDARMEVADNQGYAIKNAIEQEMISHYAANATQLDGAILGLTGAITVTEANISRIVTSFKTQVRNAKGELRMNQKGASMIWSADLYEKLENYAKSTGGYILLDEALKNGISNGFIHGGVTHYFSTYITDKVIATVNKSLEIGILNEFYGKLDIDKFPGDKHGYNFISRCDFGMKFWAEYKPIAFAISVAV